MACPLIFLPGSRILFIGDSITDGDRSRTGDVNHALGDTFVRLIAARYGADHPAQGIEFLNRGINGHRITDLEECWESDYLALQPDLVSFLIGVNDAASVVELTVPPPPRTDGRPPQEPRDTGNVPGYLRQTAHPHPQITPVGQTHSLHAFCASGGQNWQELESLERRGLSKKQHDPGSGAQTRYRIAGISTPL